MFLYFDEIGELAYHHDCEGCGKFPLDDPEEQCLICGYSQNDVKSINDRIEEMNLAYGKYKSDFDKGKSKPRSAFLHVSKVKLGGGYDSLTLSDITMNNDIRKLADLADHMVELVVAPTDVDYKGYLYDFDYYGDVYYNEDDEDDEF